MKNKIAVKRITRIALISALTCILGPLSIPIGQVPVSLTNFAVYLAVTVLGTTDAFISYVIYLLIGFVGLPVFSGFQGGPAKLFGPTGGYLIGMICIPLITGWFIKKFPGKTNFHIAGMIISGFAVYAFGTPWLMALTHMSLLPALMAGVVPFILWDIIKAVIAAYTGRAINKAISKN